MHGRPVLRAASSFVMMSPEYEMLLACARSRMDERHALVIQKLSRSALDWDALLALGRRHSVFPLLYRQLAAVVPQDVPRRVAQPAEGALSGEHGAESVPAGELERVLRSLAEDGITAIPWKGPVLAMAGYGDLSLRRFVDLDVIVRRDDVERAIGTLTELGYRAEPVVSPSQQAFLIRTQHDLAFKRDEGRLIVELHWEVAGVGSRENCRRQRSRPKTCSSRCVSMARSIYGNGWRGSATSRSGWQPIPGCSGPSSWPGRNAPVSSGCSSLVFDWRRNCWMLHCRNPPQRPSTRIARSRAWPPRRSR